MNLLCETSINISCPLQDTFDYTADLNNFGAWFPEIDQFTSTDDKPVGTIGKEYAEKVILSEGVEEEITVNVVDYSKDQHLITQAEFQPILPRMTITFQPVNAQSTKVTWRMDSRNMEETYVRDILPAIRTMIDGRAKTGLQNLKNILE